MELPPDATRANRRPPTPQAVPRGRRNCHSIASLVFLTVSAVFYGYRSRGNTSALAFILVSYFDLLLLYLCVIRLDLLLLGQGGGSAGEKARLKAAVWLLSVALLLVYSWRVCGVMPRLAMGLIWFLVGLIAVGGFYGVFICKEAP